MIILETARTIVRHATHDDAPFMLKLLNEPGWIRFIGDRNIHDLDAARAYIDERLIASYAKNGFGSYIVTDKTGLECIGLIGIVKRDTLDAPDIGYAVTTAHQGKGYAFEVTSALLTYAKTDLGLTRLYGYTLPDNAASLRLLQKLGMCYLRAQDVNHQSTEICDLYVTEFGD